MHTVAACLPSLHPATHFCGVLRPRQEAPDQPSPRGPARGRLPVPPAGPLSTSSQTLPCLYGPLTIPNILTTSLYLVEATLPHVEPDQRGRRGAQERAWAGLPFPPRNPSSPPDPRPPPPPYRVHSCHASTSPKGVLRRQGAVPYRCITGGEVVQGGAALCKLPTPRTARHEAQEV